jgi:hypothetical protein
MGLYNFKERFAPRILSGEKTHTIRPPRRYPDKPGTTLYLYTGLRTKKARRLRIVKCAGVEEIRIFYSAGRRPHVVIEGVELEGSECEAFAVRDGFASFNDFLAWWESHMPFKGQIVHWRTV